MSKPYDPSRMAAVLERLLEERNESYRQGSLRSGLDHGALGRYIREEKRPSRGSVLGMADHFGVDPNEMLELAGYEPMSIFEREPAELEGLSPEVRGLLEDLEGIGDPVLRKRLAEAMRLLVAGYVEGRRPTAIEPPD